MEENLDLPEVFTLFQQRDGIVLTPEVSQSDQRLSFNPCLPIFNFLIFFFVFWNCRFPEVCFTGKFKTLLHRTEKVCANFVEVLQGGHYVCRACDGLKRMAGFELVHIRASLYLEQLNFFQRIRHIFFLF